MNLLFVALLAAASPPGETPSAPRVKLSADRLDFGSVKAGTTLTAELRIENQGDAPLAVTRVGVTCECAQLRLSTPTRLNVPIDRADEGKTDLSIGPGAAATLKLTIDTEKLPAGKLEKRCLIVCSDRERSPLSVPFTATIERPAAALDDVAQALDAADEARRAREARSEAGPPPRIEADSYKAAFGEVYRGEKLLHTFKLRNAGAGELRIEEIRSNCACAVSKFTIDGKTFGEEDLRQKKGIGGLDPGEEAILEVEMKTAKAAVPGKDIHLSKQIRIVSNDPQRPSLALTLEATMISPFTIEPDRLDFGDVKKGEGASLSAILYSDKLGEFAIAGATTPNDEILDVAIERLPDDPKRPPSWRIVANVSKAAPLGNYNSHVELAVQHERVKEILLPLFLSVAPNVSFRGNRPEGGDFLDFDKLDGREDKTLELVIENGDPAVPYVPKEITVKAQPISDAFKAELVEIEKGMRYVVKLTAPKSLTKAKFFQGDLVIAADHPDLPVKKVKFRGWFVPAQSK